MQYEWDALVSQLQQTVGMAFKDTALFAGAVGFLTSVLVLGIAGNSYATRWQRRFGWLALLGSLAVLAYSMYRPTAGTFA